MAKYYYHGWTSEEEKTLAKMMLDGIKGRKKTDEMFREAADKLGRTKTSCQNRWYDIRHIYVEQAV